MPFFAKVLLFFSVPALLFAVLAIPALRDQPRAPGADAWRPLATAERRVAAPPGWRVVDPLTTETARLDERWAMGWPARGRVRAAAFFAPGDAVQVTVFLGPRAELEPLALESDGYYLENVMIERAPGERWRTRDDVEMRVERARYLPGPLAGDDSTLLLAWATSGERTLLVNAGGATEGFPLEAIRGLVSQLRVRR